MGGKTAIAAGLIMGVAVGAVSLGGIVYLAPNLPPIATPVPVTPAPSASEAPSPSAVPSPSPAPSASAPGSASPATSSAAPSTSPEASGSAEPSGSPGPSTPAEGALFGIDQDELPDVTVTPQRNEPAA
ncbi:MAG TPA: hypothetical protein VIZ22_04920 [Candidatus Limnocylindrales bacterium]